MIVAVQANLVPSLRDLTDELGVPFSQPTDDKKTADAPKAESLSRIRCAAETVS